jgi:hypothetical protein
MNSEKKLEASHWLAKHHRALYLDLLVWDPTPSDWQEWAVSMGWEE